VNLREGLENRERRKTKEKGCIVLLSLLGECGRRF
jgi:hypothetical protein